MTVRNSGPAVSSWEIDLPWTANPSSVWSGVNRSTPTHLVVGNEAWNGSLATGATATFGMTINYSTAPAAPSSCTAKTSAGSQPCALDNAGPATSPTPSPTATAAPTATPAPTPTPTPTPTVPAPVTLPADFKVAPYVDLSNWPTPDLMSAKAATGINSYLLGFIVSSGDCSGSWGGYSSLSPSSSGSQIDAMNRTVADLQASGGQVAVSFGGAAGTELAAKCSSAASLKAAYKSVIDRYNLTRIDFDIEGAAQSDRASNVRRGQAIAALQADAVAAGKQLTVTFTLPVLPSGLTSDGLNVLHDSVSGGARVDLVNIMAMDYGGPNNTMGQSAIDAATSTAGQIGFLFPNMSAAERITRVAITPMIGANDVAAEVFTLADASTVAAWAKANNLGGIAWWALQRDVACPNNATYVSENCSGSTGAAWAYAKAFAG